MPLSAAPLVMRSVIDGASEDPVPMRSTIPREIVDFIAQAGEPSPEDVNKVADHILSDHGRLASARSSAHREDPTALVQSGARRAVGCH